MSLAAVLRRLPAEVEAIGFHDAMTMLAKIHEDNRQRAEFDAALHGAKLK